MGVHLSAGVRFGRARQRRRRGCALFGTFAVLLQAVVFAWHHHPASFQVWSAGAVTTLVAPTAPVMPALADHDCEICFAVSHHNAVPVDFYAAKLPENAPLPQTRIAAVEVLLTPYSLFRSRAPPAA
jgi:hypothetical protein